MLFKRILGKIRRSLTRSPAVRDNLAIERFTPLEKSFKNKVLYIHDHASYKLGLNEVFRSETYKFISSKKNPYIIDCGANLGMSVLYFKELYPAAEIVAFEADEHIFQFLQKNMTSYGYEDVRLINKAVWDIDGIIHFFSEGGAGGRIENAQVAERPTKTLPCTRLKEYLQNREVDFLKLDIEGAEFRVLQDCVKELKSVKLLFVEYHSMGDRPQQLHELLLIAHEAGFRYHIKEAYTTKYPFIERVLNDGMDLQLNIFCFRD